MKRILATVAAATMLFSAACAFAAPPTITWSRVTGKDLPVGRTLSASTALNGKLYVIGGGNGSTSPFESSQTNRVDVYDPVTQTWSQAANLNTARMKAQAVTIGGKIYVFGGQGSSGRLNTLEIYDPATDTWSYGATSPRAVGYFGMTVAQGKIWVAGGETSITGSNPTNWVQIYDPATDTWTHPGGTLDFGWGDGKYGSQLALGTYKEGSYEWVQVTGGVYTSTMVGYSLRINAVAGGAYSDKWYSTSAIEPGKLDTAEGTGKGNLVSGQSAFTYNDVLYNLGGAGSSDYTYKWYNQVEYFDKASQTWKFNSDMPDRLGAHATAVVIGNQIFVTGGRRYDLVAGNAPLNTAMYVGLIPEPSSILALACGLIGAAGVLMRRRKTS